MLRCHGAAAAAALSLFSVRLSVPSFLFPALADRWTRPSVRPSPPSVPVCE